MAKGRQTEHQMTKRIAPTMKKLIGIDQMGPPKGPRAAVVIVDEVAAMSLGVKAAPTNPNRVRCPLCRRVNTVTLVSANAGKPSAFRCSYDGCRGYEWSE